MNLYAKISKKLEKNKKNRKYKNINISWYKNKKIYICQ